MRGAKVELVWSGSLSIFLFPFSREPGFYLSAIKLSVVQWMMGDGWRVEG